MLSFPTIGDTQKGAAVLFSGCDSQTHLHHATVCFCEPHLRAGTKEKCAAVLGEKLRGLSSGLVPEGRKEKEEKNKHSKK